MFERDDDATANSKRQTGDDKREKDREQKEGENANMRQTRGERKQAEADGECGIDEA